jgi:hypothetical protein
VRLRRGPAHAPPLAAVDDEGDEDVGDVGEDLADLAPSVEPPSPLEPEGVDFFSDEPDDSEPDDSEPDEDADDLAAFRLSVL